MCGGADEAEAEAAAPETETDDDANAARTGGSAAPMASGFHHHEGEPTMIKRLMGPDLILSTMPGAPPSIIISTDRVDRMRDRILQDGLEIPAQIPVLFGHAAHELPVGVSGNGMMMRERGRTRAMWRWLENDADAARVRNAFEQGALSASVGVTVHEQRPNEFGGADFLRSELVEFSLVTIPANPDCVRLLKSLDWRSRAMERSLTLRPDEPVLLVHGESWQTWRHRFDDAGYRRPEPERRYRREGIEEQIADALMEYIGQEARREIARQRGKVEGYL